MTKHRVGSVTTYEVESVQTRHMGSHVKGLSTDRQRGYLDYISIKIVGKRGSENSVGNCIARVSMTAETFFFWLRLELDAIRLSSLYFVTRLSPRPSNCRILCPTDPKSKLSRCAWEETW